MESQISIRSVLRGLVFLVLVIVEGTIERYVGRRKMVNEIEKMKDHYIICGYGRMGDHSL